MRRALVILVVGLLVVVATASVAAATSKVGKLDPNDTSGKLDMSGVGMKLKNSGALVVGIRTFGSWKDSILRSSGDNRVVFSFNTDADAKIEYVGTISTVDGQMQMTLRGKRDLGPYKVTRVDATTIEVTIPPDTPVSRPSVKVFAKTRLTTSSGTCAKTCVDRAPDSGALAF